MDDPKLYADLSRALYDRSQLPSNFMVPHKDDPLRHLFSCQILYDDLSYEMKELKNLNIPLHMLYKRYPKKPKQHEQEVILKGKEADQAATFTYKDPRL